MSAPVAPRSASATLGAELPLPQPDPVELRRHGLGERLGRCFPRRTQFRGEIVHPRFRRGQLPGCRRRRVDALLDRGQLRARRPCALEQLGVGVAAEAPSEIGQPLELALHVLEPVGLGLEREQERLQLARRLAQAQLDIAQLASCARELRRQVLERRDGALRGGGQAGGAASLLGGKRLGRLGRALRELGHVPQSLALLEQRGLRLGLQPVGVLGERAQLREPRLGRGRVPRQLLVAAARGLERAPRSARGITPGQLLGSR